MATYVVDGELTVPTLEQLLNSTSQDQRSLIDPNIDTTADSPQGQENGIFLAHVREAWEVLKVAWDANDPENAEGGLLDSICEMSGTKRAVATRSKFSGTKRLVMTLQTNTTVPALTKFAQAGNPSVRFETTETIVGTDAGDYYVSARCTVTGPVACNANTLTSIVTPVTGLESVNNPTDAILGKLQDNDPELRIRRVQELHASGNATYDAIVSDVVSLDVDGTKPIIEVTLLENYTDDIDANGLPPHSIEVIVWDGIAQDTDNDLIAQVIFDTKGAGIRTKGNSSGTATDASGKEHTVYFTRPALIPCKIEITLQKLATGYIGSDAVKDAISLAAQTIQKPAKSIYHSVYTKVIQSLGGVWDITSIRLGRVSGSYLSAYVNLGMTLREQATIDISNIDLIVTTFTP